MAPDFKLLHLIPSVLKLYLTFNLSFKVLSQFSNMLIVTLLTGKQAIQLWYLLISNYIYNNYGLFKKYVYESSKICVKFYGSCGLAFLSSCLWSLNVLTRLTQSVHLLRLRRLWSSQWKGNGQENQHGPQLTCRLQSGK